MIRFSRFKMESATVIKILYMFDHTIETLKRRKRIIHGVIVKCMNTNLSKKWIDKNIVQSENIVPLFTISNRYMFMLTNPHIVNPVYILITKD